MFSQRNPHGEGDLWDLDNVTLLRGPGPLILLSLSLSETLVDTWITALVHIPHEICMHPI